MFKKSIKAEELTKDIKKLTELREKAINLSTELSNLAIALNSKYEMGHNYPWAAQRELLESLQLKLGQMIVEETV